MKRITVAMVLVFVLTSLLSGAAMAETGYVQDMNELYATFTYILDGVQYQLPTPVSALTANGWNLLDTSEEDALSIQLEGMSYTIHTHIEKNGAVIDVYTLNPSNETLPMSECCIGMLRINSLDYDEKRTAGAALFSLPNGLRVGSTVDDILDAYGLTLSFYEEAPTLEHYWEGYTCEFWDNYYYLLKDGKYFAGVGEKDNPWDSISFNYKLVDDNRMPVLNNNTMQLLENDLTIILDAPFTDSNAKIREINLKLMAEPAPNAAETVAAEDAPGQTDETWTCENNHAGNTGNFCGECGAPKPEQKNACPSCGYEFEGETPKFCTNCGAALK